MLMAFSCEEALPVLIFSIMYKCRKFAFIVALSVINILLTNLHEFPDNQ